jgi:hypothetical protein
VGVVWSCGCGGGGEGGDEVLARCAWIARRVTKLGGGRRTEEGRQFKLRETNDVHVLSASASWTSTILFQHSVVIYSHQKDTLPSRTCRPFSGFILFTTLLLEERCDGLVNILAVGIVPCDRWSSGKVTSDTGNNVKTSVGSDVGDFKHRVFGLDLCHDISTQYKRIRRGRE